MSTINFNKRSFNVKSVLKSKTADDLVKRYKILYGDKISEANVRELHKLATESVKPAKVVAEAVPAEVAKEKK
jgi:hypothetical protein